MSARRRSKVLCQNAVPYELYTGLTFTTIWLETIGFEGKCQRLCLCEAEPFYMYRGIGVFAKY